MSLTHLPLLYGVLLGAVSTLFLRSAPSLLKTTKNLSIASILDGLTPRTLVLAMALANLIIIDILLDGFRLSLVLVGLFNQQLRAFAAFRSPAALALVTAGVNSEDALEESVHGQGDNQDLNGSARFGLLLPITFCQALRQFALKIVSWALGKSSSSRSVRFSWSGSRRTSGSRSGSLLSRYSSATSSSTIQSRQASSPSFETDNHESSLDLTDRSRQILATKEDWDVYGDEVKPEGFDHPGDLEPRHFYWRGLLGEGTFGARLAKARTRAEDVDVEIFGYRLLAKSHRFPTLFGAYEDRENYFLVLERAVECFVDLGPLRYEEIVFYSAQLLLGIREMHLQGMVHRDIKHDNILRTEAGSLLITDFGASWLDPTAGTAAWRKARLTDDILPRMHPADADDDRPMPIGCVGTTDFMAPEVKADGPYGYGVDYWSMGVDAGSLLTEEMKVLADSFLAGVLQLRPQDRLSYSQMKNHTFFKNINFDRLDAGDLPVPGSSPADTSLCTKNQKRPQNTKDPLHRDRDRVPWLRMSKIWRAGAIVCLLGLAVFAESLK
ncbi:kinase-like domain-containing protein [Mycena vulgaris]|nr:kinase-like domain-containing protein [Mycena vulgaris]